MTFDDYNYNMTNQYILIEEPQDKAAAQKARQMQQMSKGQKSVDGISEAKIEKAISEHYEHESVMLPPEEERDATPPRSEDADKLVDLESTAKGKGKKGKKDKKGAADKAGSARGGAGKAKSQGTHSMFSD